jgi:hypothetical protein
VWSVGFDGSLNDVAPVVTISGAGDVEGLVFDARGRMFAASYSAGHLFAFDDQLHRASSHDESFVIGLGISAGRITWDYDRLELIVRERVGGGVYAIPPTLDRARLLFQIDPNRENAPSGIAYLGGGELAIANRFFPRGVGIVRLADGVEISRLVFSRDELRGFPIDGVGAYGTDKLALRSFGQDLVPIIDRTGAPDSSMLPDATRVSIVDEFVLYPPAGNGNEFQFIRNGTQIFTGTGIYDATFGVRLRAFDQAALGITNGIASGVAVTDNVFAVTEEGTSTLVVFVSSF